MHLQLKGSVASKRVLFMKYISQSCKENNPTLTLKSSKEGIQQILTIGIFQIN